MNWKNLGKILQDLLYNASQTSIVLYEVAYAILQVKGDKKVSPVARDLIGIERHDAGLTGSQSYFLVWRFLAQ